MTFLILLYVLSLPVGLLLVALSVREENRRREDAHFRVVNGFPRAWYPEQQLNLPEWHGEVPQIEPPRAPDVTAHIRLVPHPTDYRKFIRVVEGASEDPFEAYRPEPVQPSTHGPMRGSH